MTAPMISERLDRSSYPTVCQPCPNDPAQCLDGVRRICECTQALLDQIDDLATGLVTRG